MKLWGGRFTKETNRLVHNFNASISYDQKFYKQDILGSIAHVTMLEKQHILSAAEKDTIIEALKGILTDIENGTLIITDEHEDIHSFVEATLIERIGEPGKKLHTGRSRNDQVALDMKLYTRDEIIAINDLLKELMLVIHRIMAENIETYMPGFTHLQKAQPVTLAHHFGAYFEMFRRDSVSDRDYLIELLSAMSTIMMHLSRFCEEIILWNSNEYRFIEMDDSYSTGSSIMPQKKNPDIAELVRGKTGRVYGALISLLTTMKGLPLAYNKDMQEDKELTFDAIDTVKGCLALFTGMLDTMKFHAEVMEDSAKHGFTNATDAADYLVNHGVAFRDAHGIIGQLVLLCLERNISLDELPLEEYKKLSPVFQEDIYEAISMKTCVEKRNTIGAPGPGAMKQILAANEKYLKES